MSEAEVLARRTDDIAGPGKDNNARDLIVANIMINIQQQETSKSEYQMQNQGISRHDYE
jgi:hypothetical protein